MKSFAMLLLLCALLGSVLAHVDDLYSGCGKWICADVWKCTELEYNSCNDSAPHYNSRSECQNHCFD